jgi:hypothetical protein
MRSDKGNRQMNTQKGEIGRTASIGSRQEFDFRDFPISCLTYP